MCVTVISLELRGELLVLSSEAEDYANQSFPRTLFELVHMNDHNSNHHPQQVQVSKTNIISITKLLSTARASNKL